MANVTFTPQQSQTYLANNPDVLNDATARARAAGIPTGVQMENFVNQINRKKKIKKSKAKNYKGFGK